ncbi:MAG: WG repeat-containing protein [Lachnospiraceae bacterium]|nr:WG repeat-containing protein [Lachnospiraceae bacterium]
MILVFTGVIFLGWIVSLRAASGVEVKETQRKLVEEADGYKEKELYIRAIPLYEDALKLKTGAELEIQDKLLVCYEKHGDTKKYIDLVESRAEKNIASENEYLNAAEYYIESYKLAKAMELIKKGTGNLDSQILRDYYEAHRYEFTTSSTKFVQILPTKDNATMPAFDGEKWGYVNSSGKVLLPAIYDTATRFDNNLKLAVVSSDGMYYSITMDGDKYGVDDGSVYPKMTDVKDMTIKRIIGMRDGKYSYYNYDFEPMAAAWQFDEITVNSCGVAAVREGSKWKIIRDDGTDVTDFRFDDVAVNSYGCVFVNNIGMVKEGSSWHLIEIDKDGNVIVSAAFANAKAPESANGYIAVGNADGKWGFADVQGNLVIDYQYYDAWSFSNGLAAVETASDWGYISMYNQLVIDSVFEEAMPFHEGVAQAKPMGENVKFVKLRYYED